MISFGCSDEIEEILSEIFKAVPDADKEYTCELVGDLLSDPDIVPLYFTTAEGCLLVRIFEGEYKFLYPIALCDGADPICAVSEIRAYAVKEEIPLVFTDVPSEDVGGLVPLFRHLNIDSEDYSNSSYTVRALNEIAMLDSHPELTVDGDFGLLLLSESDDGDYTRLCMDEETNRYWGYDYKKDEPNPDLTYFRKVAESEFNQNRAICFAVKHKGRFVGEATLYAFDFMGGCECAVRILPEHRRRGYALLALEMLKEAAKKCGIIYLRASVDENNFASIAMTSKLFEEVSREGGKVKFEAEL